MVQYHLQKLNQAGKATSSLVQLPVSMILNDSQLLAGHISSISTLTVNSSIYIQLPVDTFMSINGASVARMRNNEGKEQEANSNEIGMVRNNEEKEQETKQIMKMDLPVKIWGMSVKLTTMIPPFLGVQRAAPTPCHEIMNNTLHEQLLRPHSNTGLLKIMQNITMIPILQEVNLPK